MRPLARLSVASALLGCGASTGLEVSASEPDAGPPPVVADECVTVPTNGPPASVDVEFVARISSADVLFLVDVTGSMVDEIGQIRETLRDELAPQLALAIPDVRMAVAEFSDFPQFPYGDEHDLPFRLHQTSTEDLSQVQDAVDGLPTRSGSDVPESHVQALWHVATGEGAGSYVPPASCPSGTVGYPCFRADGSRIVLLFTDAEFHNGPTGRYQYTPGTLRPEPATYAEATESLRAIGAKVLGLFSGGPSARLAEQNLLDIARDTGAITRSGDPIIEDIGTAGQRLGAGVVNTVNTLVDEVPIDIDLVAEGIFNGGDDFDATRFIRSIETLGAVPATDVVDTGTGYLGVRPGTTVRFRVHLANEVLPTQETAQSYLLRLLLRGDGVTRLRETLVEIVIPGLDGQGCAP